MTTSVSGKAVTVSSAGDNTILTPGEGNRLRVFYIAIASDGANSDTAVTVTIRFGDDAPLYIFSLFAGCILARAIGASGRHLQAQTGESLIVTLDAAETIHVSVEYDETP